MDLQEIIDSARRLHTGVKYAKGQMIDQVLGAQDIAKDAKNPALEILALLHKSQEAKRIAATEKPLADDDIKALVTRAAGDVAMADEVVAALKYMKTEPEDKDKAKEQELQLAWAMAAPPLVKQMLLVEKVVNFEASIAVLNDMKVNPAAYADTTRKQNNPEWHRDYYNTRWEMVELALKDSSPELYTRAANVGRDGVEKAAELMPKRESWLERVKKEPDLAVGSYIDPF